MVSKDPRAKGRGGSGGLGVAGDEDAVGGQEKRVGRYGKGGSRGVKAQCALVQVCVSLSIPEETLRYRCGGSKDLSGLSQEAESLKKRSYWGGWNATRRSFLCQSSSLLRRRRILKAISEGMRTRYIPQLLLSLEIDPFIGLIENRGTERGHTIGEIHLGLSGASLCTAQSAMTMEHSEGHVGDWGAQLGLRSMTNTLRGIREGVGVYVVYVQNETALGFYISAFERVALFQVQERFEGRAVGRGDAARDRRFSSVDASEKVGQRRVRWLWTNFAWERRDGGAVRYVRAREASAGRSAAREAAAERIDEGGGVRGGMRTLRNIDWGLDGWSRRAVTDIGLVVSLGCWNTMGIIDVSGGPLCLLDGSFEELGTYDERESDCRLDSGS
ncbi:hypothetical protein Tco_0991721 [Tanacetum coccineum]|uniref:Uncharacterized protein n=1 Tax=Tanacetum coccineum TaxID=301880 RepID=A0ABQ5F1S2_9ASTR